MKTKVAVLFAGALVALLLVSRYFALSQVGLPLAWMLYLGLPITAAGVLFALRLINLGAGWTAKDMKHDLGAPARYPFCRRKRRPPSASRSSRRYTRKAQSLTSSTARGACTSSPRSDADGGWPALGQSLPRGAAAPRRRWTGTPGLRPGARPGHAHGTGSLRCNPVAPGRIE